MKNISKIMVKENSPVDALFEALSHQISEVRGTGFALVVDSNLKLIGVVADADIRRFVAKSARPPRLIDEVMTRDFAYIYDSDTRRDALNRLAGFMEDAGWKTRLPFRFIPILDEKNTVVGLLDSSDWEQDLGHLRDLTVVVGLGYVGLTTLAAFAKNGQKVLGIDDNRSLLEDLRNEIIHIEEPGLRECLYDKSKSPIEFTQDLRIPRSSPSQKRYFILCLPTPLDGSQEGLDTSVIKTFLQNLCDYLLQGDVIVMRSTVPVGFGSDCVQLIEQATGWRVGLDFHYISAPERTVEGNAIEEISRLPQILAGATDRCAVVGSEYMQNIAKVTLECSSLEVAETAKLASNAFRDYTFAFSNYLAEFCRYWKIEVSEVLSKANYGYERSNIPLPSPGVGGSCLTKDPYLFGSLGDDKTVSPILAARRYNESVPKQIAQFLKTEIPDFETKKIVAVGLAFKGVPSTSDIRNSTPIEIVRLISDFSGPVQLSDAVVRGWIPELDMSITKADDISDAEVVLILNNHEGNSAISRLLVCNSSSQNIYIFDPWSLLTEEDIIGLRDSKSVHLLSMSTNAGEGSR